MTARQLETGHGTITFPTFMPVTTFGGKYPLDDLVRPYLRRFAQCVMVSYHYAKQMKPHERPNMPLFIDSGGFASLFEGSQIVDEGDYASIRTKEGDLISPPEVLAFQEKHADMGPLWTSSFRRTSMRPSQSNGSTSRLTTLSGR